MAVPPLMGINLLLRDSLGSQGLVDAVEGPLVPHVLGRATLATAIGGLRGGACDRCRGLLTFR